MKKFTELFLKAYFIFYAMMFIPLVYFMAFETFRPKSIAHPFSWWPSIVFAVMTMVFEIACDKRKKESAEKEIG
ncbi:MAG: hypothetical protein MJ100_08565 [Ruminococcus sp.]|nr:hypothetical protein [Ruminococcus sp.]